MLTIDKMRGVAVRECIGSGCEEFDLIEVENPQKNLTEKEHELMLLVERVQEMLDDPALVGIDRQRVERTLKTLNRQFQMLVCGIK